jgi:hypothetical protein
MNNTQIKFVLAVSFQKTTFEYQTYLVSDNRLPGAYSTEGPANHVCAILSEIKDIKNTKVP